MPPSKITQTTDTEAWRLDVKRWLNAHWNAYAPISDDIVSFFDLAFENTRCPNHAWFGVHQSIISLVVGGLFLAGVYKMSRQKRGFDLLVDQDPPPIVGVDYVPVKATKGSAFPLMWAHSSSLSLIPHVIANDLIWESFASASERVRSCRYAADRDARQLERHKKRLSEFWLRRERLRRFLDEVEDERLIREGARCQVTVNAYERDPSARRQCIEHHGTSCLICGFSFEAVYGELAQGFIHVHHLRPLSEIGSEYTLDPVEDLIPVCPNCHAVFHLRKPAFSTEEVTEFLRHRRV